MIAALVTVILVCAALAGCVVAWHDFKSGAFSRARANARLSVLASIATPPFSLTAAIFGAILMHGAESKATVLAQGISESMNIGALHAPIMVASVVVWIRARGRIDTKKAGL